MKQNMEYRPMHLDDGGAELPDELKDLVEVMAERVHDEWAQARFDAGWSYGPERNDTLKQHPCLVPYSELPEEERLYDRKTAMATLGLIRSLGYKISKE